MSMQENEKPLQTIMESDDGMNMDIANSILHRIASGILIISGVAAAFQQPNLSGGLVLVINLIAAFVYFRLANMLVSIDDAPLRQATRCFGRIVDWICTYPFMQVELLLLLHSHQDVSSAMPIRFEWLVGAYFLGFGTILSDFVPRISFGPIPDKTHWYLYMLFWLLGSGCLVGNLLILWTRYTSETYGIVLYSTILWCLYPVILSVTELMAVFSDYVTVRNCDHQRQPKTRMPTRLSHRFQDLSLTILDIAAKGGLAFYVAFSSY